MKRCTSYHRQSVSSFISVHTVLSQGALRFQDRRKKKKTQENWVRVPARLLLSSTITGQVFTALGLSFLICQMGTIMQTTSGDCCKDWTCLFCEKALCREPLIDCMFEYMQLPRIWIWFISVCPIAGIDIGHTEMTYLFDVWWRHGWGISKGMQTLCVPMAPRAGTVSYASLFSSIPHRK